MNDDSKHRYASLPGPRRLSGASEVSSLDDDEPRSDFIAVSPPAYPPTDRPSPIHETTITAKEPYVEEHEFTGVADWLPYTLRGTLVWIPTLLAFSLAMVVLSLYLYSHHNHGISAETSAMFGWNFAPTLLAVIYTLLTTMIFNDVARTEPYARMARPEDHLPSASRTILETPRAWWMMLAHGLDKRKNGGTRSWAIVLSCVVNVLAFLVISPLSSAVLSPQQIELQQTMDMDRLIPTENSTLKPVAERDTFFRAIGSLLQNDSTSPWISDDYVVMPFWPSASERLSWDAPSSLSQQQWEAETTVFRNEFDCDKMSLKATNILKVGNVTWAVYSILLESADGCQYNITFEPPEVIYGEDSFFFSWAKTDDFITADVSEKNLNGIFKGGVNDKCTGNEIIIGSTRWIDWDVYRGSPEGKSFMSNLTASGQVCRSNHLMANVRAQASTLDGQFKVDFDVEAFNKTKTLVPETQLNSSDFLTSYVTPELYSFIANPYMVDVSKTVDVGYGGGAAVIAALYDFNNSEMLVDPSLPKIASRIRRRIFGELMRSSLSVPGAADTESVRGTYVAPERRITVRLEAAAPLFCVLFLSFLMLLAIIWITRTSQRPLNLIHDPDTVLGKTSFIASSERARSSLRRLDEADKKELAIALGERYFSSSTGRIAEIGPNEPPRAAYEGVEKSARESQKQIPTALTFRMLAGLLVYLFALIIAIAVVGSLADRSDLRQSLFTYHIDISSLGHMGNFAPFSIIPTLVGVSLGLWWDGLDKALRALQPYASMSRSATDVARGVGISYQSSYWLWASGKAAKNKHWLLSFVTLGTFLTQIFIVAMSALFEQETDITTKIVAFDTALELRQIPHLRQQNLLYPPTQDGQRTALDFTDNDNSAGTILSELFANLTTNWLYSGIIQITTTNSEPTWTKDDWSFIPIDISSSSTNFEHLRNLLAKTNGTTSYLSSTNLTFETSAIRARVECDQITEISNHSSWIASATYNDNQTNKSFKAYYLTPIEFNSTHQYTSLLPNGKDLACCSNHSSAGQGANDFTPVAVGYWTPVYGSDLLKSSSSFWPYGNFSVKWIYGQGKAIPGHDGEFQPKEGGLIFSQLPEIQALNCMPLIETSPAELTVNSETGKVSSYRLLEEPKPAESAWSDTFIVHNLTDQKLAAQLHKNNSMQYFDMNITVSYGVLFMNALLRASRLDSLSTVNQYIGDLDSYDDQVFNIQNNQSGLNLDFMSYASYIQAGQDPKALLDKQTLLRYTQQTFSIFFQHFASDNVDQDTGGWAFQPIGAQLGDLGSPINTTRKQIAPDGKTAVEFTALPSQNTQKTINATVSYSVDALRVNRTAFFLTLSILAWLALTTLLVAAWQRQYFGKLLRNVESLADALVLVAGSEKLVAAVREMGVDGLMKSNIKTRLGWFRGEDGRPRWGIELVEDGEEVPE